MEKSEKTNLDKKLDVLIELLQTSVAIQLFEKGVSQELIGKRLHVAKATVGKILKGVKNGEHQIYERKNK